MKDKLMEKHAQWLEEKLTYLMKPAEVMLVTMPFCSIDLPSLALGLLQTSLKQEGVTSHTLYANLLFSEIIGCDQYDQIIHRFWGGQPIYSWSFASSAFPEYDTNEKKFMEEINKRASQWKQTNLSDVWEEMVLLRKQAEAFTSICAQEIIKMTPRIVGCSSSLNQRVPTLALLQKIRQANPSIVTLMGGADCETPMGHTTHQYFPWVDYVVSGEGEELIAPLVKLIFEYGKDVPVDLLPAGVFGPLHRKEGYPNDSKATRAVALTFGEKRTPDYHEYFLTTSQLKEVKEKARSSLPIQSSRGCWYGRCKWCGLNAPMIPYRSRPAEVVLAELEELSSTYGSDRFEFLDTVLDNRYFRDLIPALIKQEKKYKLFMEIRSGLTSHQFRMMREAGIVICQPGIESLHTEALQAMDKGVSAWQNIETLKWCRQYGISPFWSILYDFPGDQDTWYHEMAELVPLLTHLYPPTNVNLVHFQPNSYYAEHETEYNLHLKPDPIDTMVYPLPMEALKNISVVLHDDFYWARRTKGSYLAALYPRPGVQELKREVVEWMRLAKPENEPTLSMKRENGHLLVTDTRPVAVTRHMTLEGLEMDLCLACIEAKPEQQIVATFIDRGHIARQVTDSIEALVKKKLLLRVDGRLLSLAVKEPFLEYVEFCPGMKRLLI